MKWIMGVDDQKALHKKEDACSDGVDFGWKENLNIRAALGMALNGGWINVFVLKIEDALLKGQYPWSKIAFISWLPLKTIKCIFSKLWISCHQEDFFHCKNLQMRNQINKTMNEIWWRGLRSCVEGHLGRSDSLSLLIITIWGMDAIHRLISGYGTVLDMLKQCHSKCDACI